MKSPISMSMSPACVIWLPVGHSCICMHVTAVTHAWGTQLERNILAPNEILHAPNLES